MADGLADCDPSGNVAGAPANFCCRCPLCYPWGYALPCSMLPRGRFPMPSRAGSLHGRPTFQTPGPSRSAYVLVFRPLSLSLYLFCPLISHSKLGYAHRGTMTGPRLGAASHVPRLTSGLFPSPSSSLLMSPTGRQPRSQVDGWDARRIRQSKLNNLKSHAPCRPCLELVDPGPPVRAP